MIDSSHPVNVFHLSCWFFFFFNTIPESPIIKQYDLNIIFLQNQLLLMGFYLCYKPAGHVVLVSSDLFEKMVPMAVQQSMGIYTQRKTETVNRLVGTMREATNLCNGYTVVFLYSAVVFQCADHEFLCLSLWRDHTIKQMT